MDVDIYRSPRSTPSGDIHIAVPRDASIPDYPQNTWGPFSTPFKQLTLKRGENRIGMDSDTAIEMILKQGYAVIGSAIETKVL